MNQLMNFNFEGNEVRTVLMNNEPYFVGKDVAEVLGYAKSRNALSSHVDQDDALKWGVPTNGGIQDMTIINESGLYSLIISSKLPSAKKFKKWVTSEVLPSIRKNGGYIQNQENLSSEQILANAVLVAQNVIAQKELLIQEMEPKAKFFDQVASSKDAIEMGQVAKVLNIPGLGRNKLFDFLRNKGVLQRNNIPYQRYCDSRHFRVIETKFTTPNGEVKINLKTLVYQKGLNYIRKLVEAELHDN